MTKAIIHGNPVDGFHVIGPFDSQEAAIEYGEHVFTIADWWTITLEQPWE